ncbi:MAG: hypothetical protein WBC44_07615, partial [Planctomycetaceae bacterium]
MSRWAASINTERSAGLPATPEARTAETSVTLFQPPNGRDAAARTPRGAQPWSRQRPVLAPVSSRNTSRPAPPQP